MDQNIVDIGRDSTEVKLFDTKGGVVHLYKSLTVDQQSKILKTYEGKKDIESATDIGLETILNCFISWNIGSNGEVFNCNKETLKKFSQRDLFAMLQACTGRQLIDENGELLSEEESAKKA